MRIPKHIAIIPDGNRRWALDNGLNKEEGYSSGTLKYSEEEGLYWEPVKDIPVEEQYITSSELMSMIEEVL